MRRSEFQGPMGLQGERTVREEKRRGKGEGGWVITRTAVEAVAVTCERAISGYA